MCPSMVDIQSATAEIRRGKKWSALFHRATIIIIWSLLNYPSFPKWSTVCIRQLKPTWKGSIASRCMLPALCVQHSPKCCGALDFLSHDPCPLNALIARFRESCVSVSISRESKRLKKWSSWLNSGNALIQHLSEKMWFSCFPFCQVMPKHKLRTGA